MGKEVIEHYGVKGMHWGVRRADAVEVGKLGAEVAKGLGSNKTKAAYSQKAREAGGLHMVSDKALKDMLSRMEMEKKFSAFMNEEADRRAKGRRSAVKLLGKVGKIALPIVISAAAARAAAPTVIRTFSQYQHAIGK